MQTIQTVYVGGVTEDITEQDIRDKFYCYGEIRSIRVVPKSSCAFVVYSTRMAAQEAVNKLHHNLSIKDKNLKVAWGRPQTLDPSAPTRGGGHVGSAPTYTGGPPNLLAPPPGLSSAPAAPAQVPYYPSMDPNLMGSRSTFSRPINLAPE